MREEIRRGDFQSQTFGLELLKQQGQVFVHIWNLAALFILGVITIVSGALRSYQMTVLLSAAVGVLVSYWGFSLCSPSHQLLPPSFIPYFSHDRPLSALRDLQVL